MNDSKICIYGAGSIGLDLAWHLIRAGNDVTLISRDKTLEALESHGIRHAGAPSERILPGAFKVTASAVEAGVHRYIFLTTKVDDLIEIASDVKHLIGPQSLVISATNGVPPWYSHLQDDTIGRFTFPHEPRERFFAEIPAAQLIGAIVERNVQLSAPGILQQSGGKGFTIGELDHEDSARVDSVVHLINQTGLHATKTNNIHREIWLKLIGNISLNPLSVITEQTVGKMMSNDRVFQRMQRLAREATRVGIRIGVIKPSDFREEQFFAFAREKLSEHRPSMLQDFQRGKNLEIHRIVEVVEMLARAPGPGAVIEIPALKELDKELKLKVASALINEK